MQSYSKGFNPGRCAFSPGMEVLSCIAGVDWKDDAGDISGLVAQQKFYRVGNVLNFGQPAKGAAAHHLFSLLSDETAGHLSIHKARRDRVDGDAQGANFPRKRPRQTDE